MTNRVLNNGSEIAAQLRALINRQLQRSGGWLPFDEFMRLALYAPNLGYYANDSAKFSCLPQHGGDFVTAPELSPLFGYCLARQVKQLLQATASSEIWEFGAGSGKLAQQLLSQLFQPTASAAALVSDYHIVELSASLKQRQQQLLQPFIQAGLRLHWHSSLPAQINGVIIGNEVLDAMPVKLLLRKQQLWYERGVSRAAEGWQWQERLTELRPPLELQGEQDYLTEIHCQAKAFIATLADSMQHAVALFIDYGFTEAQYYHPQRSMGTLICHQAHRVDTEPLEQVGLKDITSHLDFTALALSGQNAGLELLGYTNQANFLINCGFEAALTASDLPQRIMAQRLILEHEMGELFKVIALGKNLAAEVQLLGFSQGDKSYQL